MKIFWLALLPSLLALSGCSITPPENSEDRALFSYVEEIRSYSIAQGSKVWPGYDRAPFGLLLTLKSRELLLCHGSRAAGFSALSTEDVTRCDAQERGSVFPKHFLAAMPVIDGVSTIVMGTPDSTGYPVPDWTRTIFHEHFHQYQSTFENYYVRLSDLGLANGDTTGMWMLNYPFPYANDEFQSKLLSAAEALNAAVLSDRISIQHLTKAYIIHRGALERSVPAADWKYLEMQLWAEGVARLTEIELSRSFPNAAVVASGRSLKERTLKSLTTIDARKMKRQIVYPYGAAEAMLLERCYSGWRSDYMKTLAIGPLINKINPDSCE